MKDIHWNSNQFHILRFYIRNVLIKCLFSAAFLFLYFDISQPLTVRAAETDRMERPYHLIQTVSEQDLYEGLLALGFLECPVLEEENVKLAYVNAGKCVVGIHMEDAYGSGIIFQMTPERIVIASNKHVLDYWEDETGYVQFYQGYIAEGELIGVSGQYDVGFLAIDNEQLGYQTLQSLLYASCSLATYQKLQVQDEIFCVGGNRDEVIYYSGNVEILQVYIEELEGYMMQADGMAVPGMSGGGTFDAKGSLIGMLTGADGWGKTASIPLPVLLEAYEEVLDSDLESNTPQ